MLLLITIWLNDMISVLYSRFITAVASVYAKTSTEKKIETSMLTLVTRQYISKSSHLYWIINDAVLSHCFVE